MLEHILELSPADSVGQLWSDAPDALRKPLESFGAGPGSSRLLPVVRQDRRRLHMQVGYLFRDDSLLIPGSPAILDSDSSRIFVSSRDARAWLADQGPLHLDRPEGPRAAGVGGRSLDRALGPSARRAITGHAEAAPFTDKKLSAFARSPGSIATPNRMPDAIVLHADSLPESISLTLELTTACNFKCGFCYGRHLPQGLLRLADVERLLENLGNVSAVEITGEGEPLVNKDAFKIVDLFKRRGIWVHLTTNGSTLDERTISRILDSGVDRLATSLESARPERYERLRPGSDFREFQAGLRRLAQARASRRESIELYLWVTILRECVDELDDIFAFAREIGFDRVELQALNPMPQYARIYDDAMRANMLDLSEIEQLAQQPSIGPSARSALLDLLAVYSGSACAIFDTAAMAYWQGRITPCRLLKLPDVPSMGSLVETSFVDLWGHPDFVKFRFALRHGLILDSCARCPYVHSSPSASKSLLS